MKTVLQELLGELNEAKSDNKVIQTTINLIIDMVESKLEEEKEQIKSNYTSGTIDCISAEDYFNQCYSI